MEIIVVPSGGTVTECEEEAELEEEDEVVEDEECKNI
jgi:hypothetical protein